MLIDAGFPGHRDDVLASVRQLGFGVDDMHAILLTHAHVDHFGSAIWFAKTHGTPVYCHAEEVGHSKREYLEQVSPADLATHMWQPRWLKWTVAITRKGGWCATASRPRRRSPRTSRRACRVSRWRFPPPATPAGIARSSSTACWSAAMHWSPAIRCLAARRTAAAARPVQPRPGRLCAQPGRAGSAGHRGGAAGPRPGVAGVGPRSRRTGDPRLTPSNVRSANPCATASTLRNAMAEFRVIFRRGVT